MKQTDLSFKNLDNLKIKEEDKTVSVLSQAHKLLSSAKPKKHACKPVADGQRELF